MEKEVLDTIVSSFVSEVFKQTTNLFEGTGEELKQFFNRGVKKYLEKQKEKYSHIKTLLKGNTPVYLYDIYYHLKLRNERQTIDTKSVKNLFLKSNYITIIGDAGSGKSTLVKHLFLNSIAEKIGVPILVELRYLNDYNNDFESYIYEKIFENKLSQNGDILERLLNNGKFVFFLDGFDELNSETKPKIISSLNNFINSFEKNKFILTTRPYSDIEHLPLFHNYFVKPLDKNAGEIEGFIHKQLQNETELALKIVNSINANQSVYIESFLTNPLLLSLYILTFQSDSSVPSEKSVFYRRVINVLFSEHDSKTKLGYPREKLTKLNQQQFEEILKSFCLISYFESKFSWESDYVNEKLTRIKSNLNLPVFDNNDFIKDLKLALALWVDDNGMMSFAHRSLQEYFAALSIKHLNQQQNQRIYEKIIDRFSLMQNLNEVENFLSLCEEMDVINFKKYYLLPLLYDLKSLLDNSNDKKLGESFLLFFTSGVNFKSTENRHLPQAVVVNDNIVYKAIYIHLPYTKRLFDYLRDMSFKNKLSNCKYEEVEIEAIHREDRDRKEFVKQISLKQNNIPLDFWEICGDEIIHIAKEFHAFIQRSIEMNESFIKKSDELDKDLVDLI